MTNRELFFNNKLKEEQEKILESIKKVKNKINNKIKEK